MSGSSLLAAAIMFFGLVAFVVLVSGGPGMSRGPATAAADVRLATGSVVIIEEGGGMPSDHEGPDSPTLVSVDGR